MYIFIPEPVENLVHSRALRGNFLYEVLSTIMRRMPLRSYSNTTRGAANLFTAGAMIFNTDDNAPNWSDGTSWRDAMGNIT